MDRLLGPSIVVCTVLGLVLGCTGDEVVLRAASPAGTGEALVVERLSIDPPDQTLILQPPDHRTRIVLRHLAPDAEGCDEIAWSDDGERVGFLVNRRELLVFDRGGNEVAELALLDGEEVRAGMQARNVALSADGSGAGYDVCSGPAGESCAERRSAAV